MYFISHNEKQENDVVLTNRAKFYDFVKDIDNRFGRNFLECFPEMKNFYIICKQAKDKIESTERNR
jgi:hypothetical protein